MDALAAPVKLPRSSFIDDATAHLDYPIFEHKIDIFKPLDWHLDLSTGRSFPKVFCAQD